MTKKNTLKNVTLIFLLLMLAVIIFIVILHLSNTNRQEQQISKSIETPDAKDSTELKQTVSPIQKIVFIDNFNNYQRIEDVIKYNEFKDNVLYIDIWSTYCGPCLKEFQQSKDLKERYKDKPVKFIYLVDIGNTTEYITRWDSLVNEYKLYGYHMRMNNKFYNNINSITGIEFIGKPHYILVDKEGNIVYPNAERPSSKEKLYSQIDRLL